MNLNSINSIQPKVVSQSKQPEKTVQDQATQVTAEPKKKSDAGCLRGYALGGVSFGFHCSTGNFQVKKLPDVPCCCCGKPMLREQDTAICKKAVASTKGEQLAANIDEYSKYMRADEKCAATIIANQAKQSGGNISDCMKQTSGNLRELTGQYANGILDELSAMAQDAYGKEENPVADLINSAREGIKANKGLDRSTFVEKLDKTVASLGEEKAGKFQDKAMDLPQTFNHVQRIYDKYTNKKPDEAARRLFSTALTTAEHIHPHSLGGPDDTSNYIAECAGCNNPRGNMDYAQWLKVHPEYPRKAQEHIEDVEARLINGDLGKDYNSYPVQVRESLAKESGNAMVLKVLNPKTIQDMRQNRHGKTITAEDVRAAYEKQEAESENNKKSEKA